MSKFKSRLASRTGLAHGRRSLFDASELSWIMLAASGLLLFAYLSA
jgi:hypothetical protein